MTSSIGSVPPGRGANDAIGHAGANASTASASAAAQSKPVEPVSAPDPVTAGAGGAQGSEAVTLSADGQATAQLLDAARGADGVDTAKVSQLRQSLQSGTYIAKPADVAKAIAGAFAGGAGGSGGTVKGGLA